MSKKLDTQLVSNNADKTQLHKTQRHCLFLVGSEIPKSYGSVCNVHDAARV